MNNLQLIIELLLLLSTTMPGTWSQEPDVYYVAEFTDEIRDCDGFVNDVFKCNGLKVVFMKGKEDEEGSLGLSGQLDVLEDIIQNNTINLKVWKETDLSKEFMYAVAGNMCDTLQKDDTPWWPLMKSFNTSECPIKKQVYPVHDMGLSLNFAKAVLRNEFVGYYTIELSILDGLERPLSCHIISVGISEKTRD